MNVVSNESTRFPIGLDVIHEDVLVHCHITKRYLHCAIHPTGHLALEIKPSKSELGQRPASSHAALRPTTKGTGERNASA